MYIALLIFFGGIEGARRAVSGGGEWARGRVGVWCVGVCPYRCVDPLV